MSGVRNYVSGISLVMLAASLLLGGLLYLQWHSDTASSYSPPPAEQAADEAAATSDPQAVPPYEPVPLTALAEITDRPLFTEGRTPPEKPAQEEAKAPAAPLRLKLEGVAITPESKVAIITDMQTKELLRLSQGMSHGDWKVTGVSEESVTIQQGARQITLKLELEEPAAASAAAGRPRIPFRLPPPPRPPANP